MTATREISELRHEMQLGFARMETRFAQMDARFEQLQTKWEGLFNTHRASTDALIEARLREQTRFFFLAWAIQLAAIIGLYAK